MKKLISAAKIIIIMLTFGLILSGCDNILGNYPDTPKNPRAAAYSDSNIRITWEPVSNVDGYYIHLVSNIGGIALNDKVFITYTDVSLSELESDTLYSFRVTAFNSKGESAFSNLVSARTFPARPNTPTNVSAAAASEGSIRISWTAVSRAEGYKIYRSDASDGPYTELSESTSASYIHTGLTVGVRYYYRVSAFNVSGESAQSSSVYAHTIAIPEPPKDVTATAQSSTIIRISWSAVSNAESYIVYRSLTDSGVFAEIGTTVTGLSLTNSGLTPDKTYYYKVAAKNATGVGSQSNSVSASTEPVPAILLTEGEWADGDIPSSSGEQWFRFTATASTQHIHVVFGTLTHLYVQLYGSNLSTVDSSTNLYGSIRRVSRTLTIGHEYYIRVTPFSSSYRGTYKIAFNASDTVPALPSIRLTEGEWTDGDIPSSSGEQWFRFTATASTQYIHVIFGTMTYMYVQLYDSNLSTVGSRTSLSGSTRRTSRTLTIGQEYYIRVTPYASYRGAYRIAFNASDTVPALPSIRLTAGEWTDGDIPSSGGEQWFSFTATASTQYIHVIFGTLTDLYVQLYNSNLSTVGLQTRLSGSTRRISRTLTIGQEYYIRVTPYSSSSRGTYQITFNASDAVLTPPLIPLTEGEWADGDILLSGGEQWFSFTATASTQYIHVIFGTLTDLYVQLYDSNLSTVGSRTNLYSSFRRTSRTLTIGQEYYIRVTPFSSSSRGTYKIAFNNSTTVPVQ